MTKARGEARKAVAIGNRLAPWRFLLFLAVLIAGYFAYRAIWPSATWPDGVAMAFDAAALAFLASLTPLLRTATPAVMREHAARNDANRTLILLITSLLTFVAMTAISGELKGASTGNSLNYTLAVPSGATNLTFTMSGGSGDGDLYVKFGSAPTDSSYDCRPYKSGNSESCSFASPSAGTYYVRIKAYSTFSGVSLVGDYSTGGGGGGGNCGGTVQCSGQSVSVPSVA